MPQQDQRHDQLLTSSRGLQYQLWVTFFLSSVLVAENLYRNNFVLPMLLSSSPSSITQYLLLGLIGLLLFQYTRHLNRVRLYCDQLDHNQQPMDHKKTPSLITQDASSRISELTRLTHTALKVAATFHKKYEDAEQATLQKSAFLATISHEIRTPMNGVLGMTELLKGTQLTAQQQDYLDTICTSGMTLLTIIDDLLDFSKLEAGKVSIEHIPFCLDRLTAQCANLFAVSSAKKQLPLLILAPTTIPETLYGDPTRIRQVIINLLGNAFKFTETGAIELRLTLDQTETGQIDQPVFNITFSVRDTGIGLTNQQIEHLFQAFKQADIKISRQYGGTGLGLAICKQLVQLMGGEIGVRSDINFGSEFWFRLPLCAKKPLQYRFDPQILQNHNGCIVSDDPFLIAQLQQLLQGWGCTTQVYSLKRALKKPPKLAPIAIVDCSSERESEILAWLTSAADHKIVLLGYAGTLPPTRKLSRAGITATLEKPISPFTLYQQLEQLLPNTVIPKPVPEQATQAFNPTRQLSILVAEDNPISQIVVRSMLEKMGVFPIIANNGAEAVTFFTRGSPSFDLIFMDCEMPVVDGFSATEQIRLYEARHGLHRTPIIALSAHAMNEHIQQCLSSGMDKHIAKPVNLDALKNCLLHYSPTHPASNHSISNHLVSNHSVSNNAAINHAVINHANIDLDTIHYDIDLAASAFTRINPTLVPQFDLQANLPPANLKS